MRSERYQFASRSMKNVTRGATIDQKWDQANPGGWHGVPASQPKCEAMKKNPNANTKIIKTDFILICGDYLKNWRAQRLDVY